LEIMRKESRKCGEIEYSPALKVAISCARSMSRTGGATDPPPPIKNSERTRIFDAEILYWTDNENLV
jgi:hypothetical protein